MRDRIQVAISGQSNTKSIVDKALEQIEVATDEDGVIYIIDVVNALIYELNRELHQSKFNKSKFMDIKTNSNEIEKRIERENQKIVKIGGQMEILNQLKDLVLEDYEKTFLQKEEKGDEINE